MSLGPRKNIFLEKLSNIQTQIRHTGWGNLDQDSSRAKMTPNRIKMSLNHIPLNLNNFEASNMYVKSKDKKVRVELEKLRVTGVFLY